MVGGRLLPSQSETSHVSDLSLAPLPGIDDPGPLAPLGARNEPGRSVEGRQRVARLAWDRFKLSANRGSRDDGAPRRGALDRPRVDPRLVGVSALLFVTLLPLGFWAQWPYRDAPFINDDVKWMTEFGLLYAGNSPSSWIEFCLATDGEHCYPLWKLVYYGVWRVVGYQADCFRYLNWALHVASAVLLFVFLRLRAVASVAAVIPAMLWSANTSFGVDSPLLWTTCGVYPWCLALFLTAMIAVERTTSTRHPTLWALVLLLSAACTVLSFSFAIIWLPLLPVQYVLLHDRRVWRRPWFWMLVLLLVMSAATLVARHAILGAPRAASLSWLAFQRGLEIYAYSIGKIFAWPGYGPVESLYVTLPLLAGLAICAWLLPAQRRRQALLFLLFGGMQGMLIALFRADHQMNEGRYLYFSSFAICAVIGLLFEAITRRFSSTAQAVCGSLAVIMVLVLAAGQREGAASGRKLNLAADWNYTKFIESYARVLREIAARSARPGQPISFVDVPAMLPERFPAGAYLPLRGLAVAVDRRLAGEIQFLTPDKVDQSDVVSTLELLRGSEEIGAVLVRYAVGNVLSAYVSIAWLDKQCQQRQQRLLVPDFALSFPAQNFEVALGASQRIAFAGPLRRLDIAREPLAREDKKALWDFLIQRSAAWQARYLLQLYEADLNQD